MHGTSLEKGTVLPRFAALGLLLLLAATAPLAAAQWSPVGPEGGSIAALAADPDHPGVVYAGGSTVFRSSDGGATWAYAGRGLQGTRALAISAGVVYAAGEGVWRSADGGASWQPTSGLATPFYATGVRALAADPRQPGRVWAGGEWSLWLTVDGGAHWTEKTRGIPPLGYLSIHVLALDPTEGRLWVATRFGVFTATGDAKRWTSASEGLKGGLVGALAIDPTAPGVVLAANGAGVWRRQGADPWTLVLRPNGVELAFRGSRAFATLSDSFGLTTRVFHSDDHGKTWVQAQQQPDRFVFALAGSEAALFAGTRTSDGGGGVYRSLDNGVTWQPARTGLTNLYTSAVVAGLPGTGTLFAAGDTQLARSEDGGQSWDVLAHPAASPNPTPIASLLVEPLDPDTIYVAARFFFGASPVFRSEDGGSSWIRTAALPTRVDVLRADPRQSRALWAAGGDRLHHTANGGASWQAVPLPKEKFLDFRDLAVDPHAPVVLWLAGSESRHRLTRLYRSADGGQTWMRRDSGLGGTSVESIALDPSSPSKLYAATDTGLYRTTDAGASWARVQGVGGPVARVLAIPTSPVTLWAVVGTQREVRRSRDGGVTWEWARRGLDGAPVLDLTFDPDAPDRVYAATATRSVMAWSE